MASMDEEQQGEQQQQPIAPAAFTSFKITPAPKRPISTFSLFNRQSRERDDSISGAVRKNQAAINTINLSLVNITGQVVQLSNSLTQVAKNIQETSAIENLKIAQERKQQMMLADQNARRGRENNLEKGIQAALFAPVRRIGAKTRFTLTRLMNFFNILLGGFLVMRTIKLIQVLTDNNQKTLKGLGERIIKQMTAAGGIFLAINGGMMLALRNLTRLASFLTQVAVTNLLIRPIQLIFKIAKDIAKAIALGASGARPPSNIVPPGNTKNINNKNQNKNQNKNLNNKNQGISKGSLGFNFGLTALDLATGEDRNTAIAGGVGSAAFLIGLDRTGAFLQKTRNPALRTLGTFLRFGAPIGAEFFARPAAKDLFRQTFGLSAVSGNENPLDVFSALEDVQTNNVNISTVPIQNQTPLSAEGRAALLMFAPPNNPDNPYILMSHMQYNVIPIS